MERAASGTSRSSPATLRGAAGRAPPRRGGRRASRRARTSASEVARAGRRGGGAARPTRTARRSRRGSSATRRARAARGPARRPRGRGGDGQRARPASTSSAAGGSSRPTVAFADEEELRNAIERILAPLGRRVDELSPMVDARLADGSRVNVVIPPLAIDGPAVSIRRFGAARPGPRRAGRARARSTEAQRELLEEAVGARRSILSAAAPAPARRRCSTRSPASSPPASGW